MYKPIDADVIVIGSGVAGLTAAYVLFSKEPTLNVIVLEASERIGGRSYCVPLLVKDGKSVACYNVGGQWICAEQNQLFDLLDKLRIPVTVAQKPGKILSEYKELYAASARKDIIKFLSPVEKYQLTKFIKKVESLCKDIKEKEDITTIKNLSHISLKDLIEETVTSKAVQSIINYIVFLNCGIRPSQISALFYIFFCISTKGITNQLLTEENNLFEFKIKESALNICERISNEIGNDSIITGERVLKVKSERYYVEVETEHFCYSCYDVIIAIAPMDILKIKFSPSLPEEKVHAIKNTNSNVTTSFVITYPRDFWTETGLSGDIYVFDKRYADGPIDYCVNISTYGKPALAGKIFGGKASYNKQPLYKRDILEQLAAYFGEEALMPTDYCEKSWNFGQMSCWDVQNINYIKDIITEHKRVFWAGAETSSEWYGTLAGAVHSGIRVALEVLYDLRPSVLTTDDMLILSPTRRSQRKPGKTHKDPVYNTVHNAVGSWKYYIPIGLLLLLILWKLKNKYVA